MTVSEAIAARRSVRGFLDTPVEPALIRAILEKAARAPSGGNLQPWHIDVVTGHAMSRLKALMRERLASGAAEAPAYDIYPANLTTPYRDRRFTIGEAMYAHIGIPREDKAARRMWFARNFQFFGAPAAIFCTVDRQMGPPQWSDLGMFLQSVMLLAIEAGLATCPQECWAIYPDTINDFLGTPANRMLFCGMAIGHEDSSEPANRLRAERAPIGEWAAFHD
ncbi:nitroreductase family protein [Sphingomonas sp. LaA6.9]|uniref:nitroreductase family protein n=1 Tax=Sphingomonas sp. LaA6.9 TaxID=2919914 RepID=UPI001F4F856E|nr:nitroreductase family protein [Sphingomonas sp. LaA6.9]MCJ8158141.1 nitroreductase family protein [Sphingomonas sp. LaA6.9]